MWIIILFNIVKIEILQGKYYYGGREREYMLEDSDIEFLSFSGTN